MEIWETKTYVVYPGAKVTIENADMKFGGEDKKYPSWAFIKNRNTGESIDFEVAESELN